MAGPADPPFNGLWTIPGNLVPAEDGPLRQG